MKKGKKIILMDFDGVIHDNSSNDWYWEGVNVINGDVVKDMKETIEGIRKDYNVVVYSSRCLSNIGKKAVVQWLEKKDIEVDGVTDKKLAIASIIVDDRAIYFDGSAEKLKENIKNFKVWTKKP